MSAFQFELLTKKTAQMKGYTIMTTPEIGHVLGKRAKHKTRLIKSIHGVIQVRTQLQTAHSSRVLNLDDAL